MLWLLMACSGGKAPPESPVPAEEPAPVEEPTPVEEPAPAPAPEPSPVPVGAPEGQASGMCGGIAGMKCPDGHACMDDPADSCDPKAGGRDCSGRCVACDETGRTYMGDPETCSRMRFQCAADQVPFFDDCGCGCEGA